MAEGTYLQEIVRREYSSLARLHEHLHAVLMHQFVHRVRGEWAASLPYPQGVFASYPNGKLRVRLLLRGRAVCTAEGEL